MASHNLIRDGVYSCIRNGRTTNILNHPQLADVENPRVVTTPPPRLMEATVSSLFFTESGNYEEDLINDLFEHRDVELILKVLVNLAVPEDI